VTPRILLAAALTALAVIPIAGAQERPRDAGSKALGKVNSFWVGSTSQRHAYERARVLNQLGRSAPAVSREIAQGQVNAIRTHSQAAMKEFGQLKADHPDDKAVQLHVENLKKHHDKVLAMCSMLDEECKKAEAGGVMICECCLTMAKELDAAAKDAEKLREALKIDPLADPLKEEVKK
jgi:hypothetical protein